MSRVIKIRNRLIGNDHPCMIVAEAGANHNGDMNLAKELARSAAESGADAVKFQTYVAEKLATRSAPKYWKDEHPDETQYETFKKLDRLSESEWKELAKYCEKIGILFFSTPFDFESVNMLDELDVPVFKVASADITHIPLLKYIAEKGKPIILSTGASTLPEIREAVEAIKSVGNNQLILLHCTLSYPTDINDANLRAITTLQNEFPEYPVGLSDHTTSILTPIVGVAMGAKVIEKHFTVNKSLPGSPDHKLSIDPKELAWIVQHVRLTERLLGCGEKKVVDTERKARALARRSIVAKVRIPAGTPIRWDTVTFKRPGLGLPPSAIYKILGRKTIRTIEEDEVITAEDIEGDI